MTEEELVHHFAALAERIEDQTRVIAEGHQILVEKFVEVNQRLDRLEAGQAKLEMEVVVLQNDLRSFKEETRQRFEAHDARFDAIERRLDAHDARFDAIERRLDAHDARFDAIERRLDAHDARFDAHDARFDAHDARFDALEDEQRRFAAAVMHEFAEVKAMIKFSLAELDRRIATLEHAVQDLAARVERLESRAS